MSLEPAATRIDGYRRRALHEWRMWEHRRLSRRQARRFDRWIHSLQASPPDAFVGPDLPYGGVRGHVRAIAAHSSLQITLVPDEKALGGLDQFSSSLRERFMEFDPLGSPTVHSHVIPWMIHWCHRQQERGLRWIHTYHLPYFPEHGRRGVLQPDQIEINEALLHEARHADLRLSVSKWQRDFLLREHGIESIYLPNGVDVAACDRGNADRFQRRHRLREPFLLWVGRNDPVKNPADFVRLAHALPDRLFAMLGPGLDPGTLRDDWDLETPPNLRLLGGASHAEVQDALAACAALVVTSKREGLPTLVLEGMAHAKPLVVPDEDGCLEAVGGGEFGRVYRPGDIGGLAAQSEAAFAGVPSCPTARQRVLDEYDWRVVAPKLDAMYQN